MISNNALLVNFRVVPEHLLANVAHISPSKTTPISIMIDLAVDCVKPISKEIKRKKLPLMRDKGEGVRALFAKLMSWYDDKEKN